MMGSFLSRALVMVFGYAYPAYECFKTVEKHKPEIEQLLYWCQYWILVALLTVFERVGDTFISWLPMYSETKLAFFIYLWYPRTKGTAYVYKSFFQPYVAKHEKKIDRTLLELRVRVGKYSTLYWQKAATYGQARFLEILQYASSPSASPSRPDQISARKTDDELTCQLTMPQSSLCLSPPDHYIVFGSVRKQLYPSHQILICGASYPSDMPSSFETTYASALPSAS